MKTVLAKHMKGKLYVEAAEVPALVEAEIARRRLLDRPAEPDETVLPILAAARHGDAAELSETLRRWADSAYLAGFCINGLTTTQARRAAELIRA